MKLASQDMHREKYVKLVMVFLKAHLVRLRVGLFAIVCCKVLKFTVLGNQYPVVGDGRGGGGVQRYLPKCFCCISLLPEEYFGYSWISTISSGNHALHVQRDFKVFFCLSGGGGVKL